MVRDQQLETVLDEYSTGEIQISSGHDGFRIYRDVDDELLWSWDPAHDAEPFQALETLFERCGYEVTVG